MSNTAVKTIFFFVILQLGIITSAQAMVYLDFTSPTFRKVPVAVPYFINKATGQAEEVGKNMAALLGKGLEFHGFISVVPPGSYGGRQDMDWKTQGVDMAILGQYTLTETEINIEVTMMDVQAGHQVFGRKYGGVKEKYKRMILRFCDDVIEQLTGEQGVSQTRIAFVSDASGKKEIYVADILGEGIRQVTRHKWLAVAPRFSPDGGRLAYTSYHSGNPNLYVTDLNQDKVTKAISKVRGLNMAPAWTADGSTMALTLGDDANPNLFLMSAEGKIQRQLTDNAGLNVTPSWSPEGDKLAFCSDRSGTPQIYVMDVKSGSTNRITFNGNDNSQPAWSPKGDWIAYTSLYEGAYQIFLVKPDGSSPVQLSKVAGESPSWSPDGQQLIFSHKANGRQQLYLIFKNGNGLRPWFRSEGNMGSPQWSNRLTN